MRFVLKPRLDLFVLSDIPLGTLPEIDHLLNGPVLFQRHNLLPPPTVDKPGGLQMLIGRRGSYTSVHYDWFGMDGYIHLLEGRKVWWIAPPHSQAAFRAILEPGNVNVSMLSGAMTSSLLSMGACAIVQQAGDVVFVPGGWVHCVKNLTDTVAFGGSYLRAWKLPYLIQYLISTTEEVAVQTADQLFDWRLAIPAATGQPALYGIDVDEASEITRLHAVNKRRFHTLTSSSTVELKRANALSVVYEGDVDAPPVPKKRRGRGR